MSTTIGPYCEGEVPEPLEYSFLDAAGTAIDLSGFTATFRLSIDNAIGVENPATISSPEEGTVTYTWETGDITQGVLRAEFEVTNGTNTYISDRLIGFVATAVPVAP